MSRTLSVEHLARVEGHGGFVVSYDETGVVTQSDFEVFEGMRLLEGLIRGRAFADVAPLVSRICAICSVAHTLASLRATERAFGVTPDGYAASVRDLLLLGESIQSHALHLVFLALPDYVGSADVVEFAQAHGDVVEAGLRVKKAGNTLQTLLGGRAIHPVTPCVGGFVAIPTPETLLQVRAALDGVRDDAQVIAGALVALPPPSAMQGTASYAALRTPDRRYGVGDTIGIWQAGRLRTVPLDEYRTLFDETVVPHSHAKHSRIDGQSLMVGALARLVVNRDWQVDGVSDAAAALGLPLPSSDPLDNNRAQAVELVLDLERASTLVDELLDREPEGASLPVIEPRAATGIAAVEAPRGILVHEYEYDAGGRIVRANVVTPTAVNAASIEDHLRLATEQELADVARRPTASAGVHRSRSDDRRLRQRLEMLVRAYDPCISCSVHVLQRSDER